MICVVKCRVEFLAAALMPFFEKMRNLAQYDFSITKLR